MNPKMEREKKRDRRKEAKDKIKQTWTICPYTGKRRFSSESRAQDKLKEVYSYTVSTQNYRVRSSPVQTYFCKSCKGWHLTSQKSKKKKK